MALRSSTHRAFSLVAALRRNSAPAQGEAGGESIIEGIAFNTSTIRTGDTVVAKIRGPNLHGAEVKCEAMSTGFLLDLLPQPAVQEEGEQLMLAMRVFRGIATPRGLCLVRVTIGASSAVASITVRV